jgi:hypothetical protein
MGKLNRSISLLKPTLRSFIAGLGFIALSGQTDAAVLTANLNGFWTPISGLERSASSPSPTSLAASP